MTNHPFVRTASELAVIYRLSAEETMERELPLEVVRLITERFSALTPTEQAKLLLLGGRALSEPEKEISALSEENARHMIAFKFWLLKAVFMTAFVSIISVLIASGAGWIDEKSPLGVFIHYIIAIAQLV